MTRGLQRRRGLGWLALATALLAGLVGKVETFSGWDETYYLGQLSSIVEDGDLDLRNDALWSTQPPLELRRLLLATLPSGNLANTFSIGPAVAFAPAYLAGLLTRPWSAAPAPRWDGVQLAALHALALALAFGVVCFLHSWLRRSGVRPGQAFLGTLALVMGTPLLIYGFRHYAGSHLVSTVAACAFVGAVHAFAQRPTALWAAICGAFLGFLFLARWQDVVFAMALLVPTLALRRAGAAPIRWLALAACGAAAFAGVASLQLHVWGLERGQFLAVPQGAGYVDLGRPQLAKFLFSGLSGLLPWSPIVLLCVVGLLLPWRLRLPRAWALVALATILVQIYLNACVTDWWGGASYGARRMTSLAPFLALGLGNALVLGGARGAPRFRSRLLSGLLVLACAWGAVTAQLYRKGVQDLTPLFLDRPSVGAEQTGVATPPDRVTARRALGFPISLRVPNYLGTGEVSGRWQAALGRSLGVAAMFATLFLAVRYAAGRRRGRTGELPGSGPALAAALLLLIVAAFHVRLLGAGPIDREERAAWRRFASAAAAPAPDHALLDREMRPFDPAPEKAAGAPAAPLTDAVRAADAYRYVHLWSLWQRNRAGRAQGVLRPLAARGYPAARALAAFGESAGPDGTIRLAIPGTLLGRNDSELRLHLRGERALTTRALVVRADLSIPGSEGQLPVLALLAGPTVLARFELADGDSLVRTPGIELQGPAAPLGWRGRRTLHLVWDGPTATVSVAASAGGSGELTRPTDARRVTTPLVALGAAPADFALDELQLVIAPAAVPGGGAGIAIANLMVATAPR